VLIHSQVWEFVCGMERFRIVAPTLAEANEIFVEQTKDKLPDMINRVGGVVHL
jgi:hypothetical protein